LTRYFGNIAVRISHIGSTAVEGLTAKPTVDILLEATPDSSPETVREIAIMCGYTVMSVKLTPDAYTEAKGDFIRSCLKGARNRTKN